MVDFFINERTSDALAEMRAIRKRANEEAYLGELIDAIDKCTRSGDGYADAIEHWIHSLDGRIDTSMRRLKIPHVLRKALGLATQDVLLEEGSLWSSINGKKSDLLYSRQS
jgi:hypothetical protein